MSGKTQAEYDVVIVGGGMVGTSLACVLNDLCAKTQLKILLVESIPIRPQSKAEQPSFDARTTVLSFGTCEYLAELGLWEALEASATPINNIHVSEQGKFGAVRMDSIEQGVNALGYVIENQEIGVALNDALLKADSVHVLSPARVKEIRPGQSLMTLIVEQQGESRAVTTKLVVLAEGGRSGLCEQLGIFRSHKKYQQAAIIANVAFSEAHNNIAYERFTAKGPLALLPLSKLGNENRAALIWTHDAGNVDAVMALDDDAFLKKLQDDFGTRVGEFTRVGQRKIFPLVLEQAEEQVRNGIVLLGNVAHTLHPVAGQGFNLAFRDTMRLAKSISEALEENGNPGEMVHLQSYLASTEMDQDRTIGFSHYMTQLFSNDSVSLSWARKFGLLSIDLLPPLRTALAKRAMGQADTRVSL